MSADGIDIGNETDAHSGCVNAIAFGRGSMVIGDRAIAIGIGAQAVGDNAMAIGHRVIALTGEQKIQVTDWFKFLHECRESLFINDQNDPAET